MTLIYTDIPEETCEGKEYEVGEENTKQKQNGRKRKKLIISTNAPRSYIPAVIPELVRDAERCATARGIISFVREACKVEKYKNITQWRLMDI
jgi:hypothetical protein